MSTNYKHPREVPSKVLAERLKELSRLVSDGQIKHNEFTMRIPAEVDRDADIVLMEAARRLLENG